VEEPEGLRLRPPIPRVLRGQHLHLDTALRRQKDAALDQTVQPAAHDHASTEHQDRTGSGVPDLEVVPAGRELGLREGQSLGLAVRLHGELRGRLLRDERKHDQRLGDDSVPQLHTLERPLERGLSLLPDGRTGRVEEEQGRDEHEQDSHEVHGSFSEAPRR
jgi:hypothetical protein